MPCVDGYLPALPARRGNDPVGWPGNIDWEPPPASRLAGCSATGGAALARCAVQAGPSRPGTEHIAKETTQTQIGIAYPSVPIGHADYYAARQRP